jgi:hypothetical protein
MVRHRLGDAYLTVVLFEQKHWTAITEDDVMASVDGIRT